jgi:hypothetical protein
MKPASWLWLALSGGAVAGLTAGVATVKAAPAPSAFGSGVSAGLVAATLVAIVWYSWETRRLVDMQQASSDIDKHPWLSATTLKPESQSEGGDHFIFGGFRLWLPVTNVGRTPAYGVQVATRLNGRGHEVALKTPAAPISEQIIVPSDVLHAWVGDVGFVKPRGGDVDLDVDIQYATVGGGGGRLELAFRLQDGAWRNGPMRYSFGPAETPRRT